MDSCENQIVSAVTNVEVLPAFVEVDIPDDIDICEGDPISFTPSINGGLEPYFYVWYLNGSIVSTDLTLALTIWGDDLTTDKKDGLSEGEKIS